MPVTTRSKTGSLPTPNKKYSDYATTPSRKSKVSAKSDAASESSEMSGFQFRLKKTLHEMWFFVVLLAPFSYTYHYHGKYLWGRVVDRTTPFQRAVVIPFVLSNFIFWSLSLFLSIVDLYKPKALIRYKIQETKFVTTREWLSAIGVALRNQIFVSIPFALFAYWAMDWRGNELGNDLPSIWIVWRDLFAFLIVEEIMFYYSHRFLHYGIFYKKIHKIHHEFTYPIGLAAIYAHPIEMVLSNLLPLWTGPFLMKSHVIQLMLWYSIALISTINSHSGYWFPGMPSPLAHDYHHSAFVYNYGVLGILDRFHQTEGRFSKYVEKWSKTHPLPLSKN